MDIRRVPVYVPNKTCHVTKFVPAYEIPILREVMKKQSNSADYKLFGVVQDIHASECGVVENVDIATELQLLKERYTWAFVAAYPTDNAFEAAFEQCVAEYGVRKDKADTGGKLAKREKLPIEQIKGIGPKFADGVAELLGDGEIVTLANAKPFMLAGIAGVKVDEVAEFVQAARDLAGIKDELTIADPGK